MKLEITEEAVKRAAVKCETAKGVLMELFPEVFRREKIELGAEDLEIYNNDSGVSIKIKGEEYGNLVCFTKSGYLYLHGNIKTVKNYGLQLGEWGKLKISSSCKG